MSAKHIVIFLEDDGDRAFSIFWDRVPQVGEHFSYRADHLYRPIEIGLSPEARAERQVAYDRLKVNLWKVTAVHQCWIESALLPGHNSCNQMHYYVRLRTTEEGF